MLVPASAEGVAGITAAGTLIAAAGLAFVTLRTTRLRLEHQRALADLDDLRKLLDETAIALHEALKPMKAMADTPDVPTTDLAVFATESIQELTRADAALRAISMRLGVRLGTDHVITKSVGNARWAMNVMINRAEDVMEGRDAPWDARYESPSEERDATYADFARHVDEFFKATLSRVGAVAHELPAS